MEKIPYLGREIIRWQAGNSTFLAMPEQGARLMHWNITLGDGSVREVIYWPELASFDDAVMARGGNPILFPFNARTYDQGDIHFWRDPKGVRRPMPMHGFARQSKFKLTWCDDRGFGAQLVPDEATKAAYPYDYEFLVTYLFEPLGLSCEFTLKNLGADPLPWCAGHHFYFAVPWNEGLSRGDYGIRIPAGATLRLDQSNGNIAPGPQFKAEEDLSNPALIDLFHTRLKSNLITFGPKHQPGEVAIKIGTAKVPPPDTTVVTWTASEQAPFYCVEPWMGPANSPEHKLGLQWVPPGQTQSFVVRIDVK